MDVDKVDDLVNELGTPVPEYLDILQHKKDGLSQFVVGTVVEDHLPLGGTTGATLEWFVRGTERMIDPRGIYFVVKGRIAGLSGDKTGSGASDPHKTAAQDDKLSIEQNFIHSLFSSIDVLVNDVNITPNNMNYPYISFFEHLFNMSSDARNTLAHEFMWTSTDADREKLLNGGQFSGILTPRTALFQQECFISNFLDLKIILNRNTNPRFYLRHTGTVNTSDPFHVELTSVVLRVRKPLISDVYNDHIESMLSKGFNLRYLLRDVRVVTKSFGNAGNEITEENLCHNLLPYNLVVGFVDTNAFSGDYTLSPFKFTNLSNQITEVGLFVNGQPFPTPPIKMNFASKDTIEAYHYLHEAIQSNTECDLPLLITKKDFDEGKLTLFAFNMAPDQRDSVDYRKAFNQNANVRLYVKFSGSISTSFVLVYFYMTGADMIVNKLRQVTYVSR
jgi:hypothetical protein